MTLFTDLIKDVVPKQIMGLHMKDNPLTPHQKEERQHVIAEIQEAYGKLDPKGREAFIAEAKQYMNDHHVTPFLEHGKEGKKLEQHLLHPRSDAAVFVFQTAVLKEINDVNNLQKNEPDKLSPDAVGILHSKSYHNFESFTSKLDSHSHPDGLYGNVTHKLAHDKIYTGLLKQIMKINDDAHAPTPPKAVEPTPPPVKETKKEEVTPAQPTLHIETAKQKLDPNLIISHSEDFGKGPSNYSAGKNLTGTGSPNDHTFLSPTAAKGQLSTTDIKYQQMLHGDKLDLVGQIGVQLQKLNVKDADNNVNLSKHVGYTDPANTVPDYVKENGTYAGKPAVLGTSNTTSLTANVEARYKVFGENAPALTAGVGGKVGYNTTQIFNNDITQSGVDIAHTFTNNTLPSASKDHSTLVGGHLMGGVTQSKYTPYLNATLDKDKLLTTSGLHLGYDYQLSQKMTIGAQLNYTQTSFSAHHDGVTAGSKPEIRDGIPTGNSTPITNSSYQNMDFSGGHGLGGQVKLTYSLGKSK